MTEPSRKVRHVEKIADKPEVILLCNAITAVLSGVELADGARVIAEIDRSAAGAILRRCHAVMYASLSEYDRKLVALCNSLP